MELLKRTVDEADETWQTATESEKRIKLSHIHTLDASVWNRTTLLDDIEGYDSDTQLEILKVTIQDNVSQIDTLRLSMDQLQNSNRQQSSQIATLSSQIATQSSQINLLLQEMNESKDKNRKNVARLLAGDLVYMFQDKKGVDRVEDLLFPTEKSSRYARIAKKMKDSRLGDGHPGKFEYKNISWSDLLVILKKDYFQDDVKDILELFTFIKNDLKAEKPFNSW
jgi:hypothetical protein